MEGLPRMPMLSVELKYCPASTDFGPKLKESIATAYEENPETYAKEIEELNQLRENAIKAPADFTGCSTWKKYFAQLYLLKSRFPMEENDAAAVQFTWYEKFSDMPSPVTYEDVRYELSCVFHNIGAVHSHLATLDSRLSSDGMKISCTHFQCAAWAFQTMRDDAEPFRFTPGAFSPDFDRNILDWYTVLMLAQAQECILEKSLLDSRKSHIIAKVAAQVSDYYAQTVRILEQQSVSDVVGSSKCRSWKKFIEMKRKFYRAIAYYELGVQADEQQKMGERLAYFQAAATDLTEATKLGHKDGSEVIQQSLQFAEDVIVGRLNQAKKENDFIYHDKIPALDSLTELKGASLVKPIPFDPLDADISGGDIFKRLIPLEVHRTSSLYSEEKAKLLRHTADSAEAKNSALNDFMASLKVDQLMLDVEFNQLPLPEALIERCAAFNAQPSAVSDLLGQMSKLTTYFQEVDVFIMDTEKNIQKCDKDLKDIMIKLYGTDDEQKAKLPNDIRSSIIGRLKSFRDELERYRRAHEQATKANADLHKALSAHSENLHVLSSPLADLKKQLPAPPGNLAELPETVEMKRLLAKVDEMKCQRDMLMEQFRQQVRDDDVTKALLAAKDKDEQEVFAKELKKHEKQISVIEQNLSAQENIIKALTEANAKYGEIRKQMNSITKQRDAKIMNLIAAFDVYTDLEKKSNEGIVFYEKLEKSLQELEAALTKWKTADLEPFIKNNTAELEKKAAAAMEAANGPAPSAMNSESAGPKLKDYMAYYRAKKAGQTSSFPTPGVTAIPTTGVNSFPTANASINAYQTPGMLPATTINAFPATTIHANAYPASNSSTMGMNAYPPQVVSTSNFSMSTVPMNGVNAYAASTMNFPNPNIPMSGMGAATFPTSSIQPTPYPSHTTASFNQHHPMVSSQQMASHQQMYTPQQMAPTSQTAMPQQYMTTSQPMAMNQPATMPQQPMVVHQQQHIPTPQQMAMNQPMSMPQQPTSMQHQPGAVHHQPTSMYQGTSIPQQQPAMHQQPMLMPQQMPPASGMAYSTISLEALSSGSDYVQLRWRYDGPRPVKFMITFRGYQRYDAGNGHFQEQEVDTGAPVKVDTDHYLVHNLRQDTNYAFEVSAIDESTGRILVKSQTIRVTTSSFLL